MTKPRLSRRFLHDLEPLLELNQPLPNVNHAGVLVMYFIECVKSGLQPDRRVLTYFAQAIERAGKSGHLGRELGLVRMRRGNPGIRSAKREKRRLSADDQTEILLRLAGSAQSELAREISRVSAEYCITRRHVQRLWEKHQENEAEVARILSAAADKDESGN